MTKKQKLHKQTIYMFNSDVTEWEQALNPDEQVKQKDLPNLNATLFYKMKPHKVPSWFYMLKPHADLSEEDFCSKRTDAVLLFKTTNRFFAITFGHGRHMLRLNHTISDFGFKVCLNSVDPKRIKGLNGANLESNQRKFREQLSGFGDILKFKYDRENELMETLDGYCKQEKLGYRMDGKAALYVTNRVPFEELDPYFSQLMEQYSSTAYRDHFPWIDWYQQEKDPVWIGILEDELEKALDQETTDNIYLSPPDFIKDCEIDWYSFSYAGVPNTLDLNLAYYLRHVSYEGRRIVSLKKNKIYAYHLDGSAILKAWSVYDCLLAEITYSGRSFFLQNGKWIRVQNQYLEKVNHCFDQIKINSLPLPKCNKSREDDYNSYVAEESPTLFQNLDKDNVMIEPPYGKVEVCDLVFKDKTFIFNKKYSGSAAISHLCAQVKTTATLLLGNEDFRRQTNQKLRPLFKLDDPRPRPDPTTLHFVLGIIQKGPANKVNLPFLSKRQVVDTFKYLSNLGIRMSITKIEHSIFDKSASKQSSKAKKHGDVRHRPVTDRPRRPLI